MPRRTDLESILLIGSGDRDRRACEFDYAGCQALKVLREDGFRTIVVNSNPATIMTDPASPTGRISSRSTSRASRRCSAGSGPTLLLPTMGGQTALNLARELAVSGLLDELGVELIGAPLDVIDRAEDNQLFKACVERAGLRVPRSQIVTSADELRDPRAGSRASRVHARRARRRLRGWSRRAARAGRAWPPRARSARCSSRSRCAVGTSSSSRSCATATTTS
jgi:hypothetical protein